jgi:hypothetical protein
VSITGIITSYLSVRRVHQRRPRRSRDRHGPRDDPGRRVPHSSRRWRRVGVFGLLSAVCPISNSAKRKIPHLKIKGWCTRRTPKRDPSTSLGMTEKEEQCRSGGKWLERDASGFGHGVPCPYRVKRDGESEKTRQKSRARLVSVQRPAERKPHKTTPRAYFAGREPEIRMSTSLLALGCQSGLVVTWATPTRARRRSIGTKSFRTSPLSTARFTRARIASCI